MSEPFRVALIDDHGLCRRGLAELLELRAGMKVVGTTGNPDETVELLKTQKPDLAVMDLRMAPTDGLRVLQRLKDEGIAVPIVILTLSDSADDLATALRLGVRGYLLKDMEPQDVIDSIARAARGELVVAPVMAAKLSGLLQDGHHREQRENSLRQLTTREREILIHVARGLSNKAIARELGISHDTVKLHVRHILSKLNLVSRVEAAVFAIEHRIDMAELAGEPRPRVVATR